MDSLLIIIREEVIKISNDAPKVEIRFNILSLRFIFQELFYLKFS